MEAGRDQLRPEQIRFLNELKAAGGLAFVAYDFAQFQQSFDRRGLHLVATTASPDAARAPLILTRPPGLPTPNESTPQL